MESGREPEYSEESSGKNPRTPQTPLRSLDDVLESAGEGSSVWARWRLWMVLLSLGTSNASDASEILCLSYLLSNDEFNSDILLNSASRASLLAASVFCGMLLGGLFVGAAGDISGRRPMVLIGLGMNAGAGVLSSFSWNAWIMSLCRFVAGLGIGASIPPLFTLCSELAPARDRGLWVSIMASFWMVGSVYVAVAGWVLFEGFQANWRVFAFVSAFPSVAGFVLMKIWVPESPRYLGLHREFEQAVLVVQQLLDYNASTLSPWTLTEAEHQYAVRRRGGLSGPSDGTQPIMVQIGQSFRDFVVSTLLLYTKPLRQTTISLQLIWFSLSFGSYGLLTWINTLFEEVGLQNVYSNTLLFALSNLPGNLATVLLLDKVGRIWMLTGSLALAAISLLAFSHVAAVDDSSQEGDETPLPKALIVWSACAFQCFTVAAWNCVGVLTSELFPTMVRNTGLGVCTATGRVSAMAAQVFNGYTVHSSPGQLLTVAAGTLLLGAVSTVGMPADKTGQAVEDSVDRHDGEEEGDSSGPGYLLEGDQVRRRLYSGRGTFSDEEGGSAPRDPMGITQDS